MGDSMKSGIYPDMPAATYYGDPCPEPSLSQSIAKVLLDESPAHAWLQHPRMGKRSPVEKYDKPKAIGTVAHKLMLGRGRDVVSIDANDMRTKAAQETHDAILAEGKTPILVKHRVVAEQMVKAARDQLDAAGCDDAFRWGSAEVALIWEEDGIWFRSLVDWVNTGGAIIYDYKTSGRSAHPLSAAKVMAEDGWDIQASFQERGFDVLAPELNGRRRFRFVMQENEPPYALTVHELPESVMHIGRMKVERASKIWRYCMNNCVWPAYEPIIHRPEFPDWAKKQFLDREVADAARNEFCLEAVNAG